MLRVLIAALAAVMLVPATAGAQTFGNEISYGWAANSNYHAFAADFNGDGILDIGLQDTSDGSWFIKHGPGFADQAYFKWAAGTNYQAFAADMNGDGKADIGLRSISEGTFYWLYGPDFTVQSTLPWTPGGQYSPVVADFTGDGLADLAVRESDTGTIWIRRSPGFAQQYTYAGPAGDSYQPIAADFNGDGKADLGLRFVGDGTFSVRLGPDFNTQFTYQWAPGANYQPFAGDANHDGLADLGLRNYADGKFYIRTQQLPAQAAPTPVPATKDADGDNVEAPLDCNDANPAIRPGATDIPGDGIDQDCSGADATLPALKAHVTFSWGFLGANTVINKILITDLAGGETVKVACKGKGCPQAKTYKNLKAGKRNLGSLFGRKHKLRTGAKLTVTLTKPSTLGSTTTLTVRKRRQDPSVSRRSPR